MPSCQVEIMPTERSRWARCMDGEIAPASESAVASADLVGNSADRRSATIASSWLAGSQSLIFPALWLLIGAISAIDTYLTVKFRESLIFLESNPIANILLDLDEGDASLLIGFKFLGSIIALGILAALYFQNRRIGLMVSSGLACFQVGLLCYLCAA